MEQEPDLEAELVRFQTSYIELLHRTSTEIEKLKLIIHILSCVDQNKEVPKHIKAKLQINTQRLQTLGLNQRKNNINSYMEPTLQLTLYHEAEQKVDRESYLQQIAVFRDSKLTLIKSSSFEMDRLRKIIKYLMNKIYPNSIQIVDYPATPLPHKRQSLITPFNGTEYGWDEIVNHCDHNDLWLVHSGKIYDISSFLRFHPGGGDVIMEIASKNQDITQVLKQLNHPPIAKRIMMKHFIGNVEGSNNVEKHQKQASFPEIKPIWMNDNLAVNDTSLVYDDDDLLIKWVDALSVKIDILDKQHENLINIINNLYNKYEIKDIMELLHRWDVHCKTEETLFYYYHFDDEEQQKHIIDHKRIYHKIKDQITDLRIKYDNQKPRCHELIDFAKRFVEMFKTHHGEYDNKYIDHLDK